LEITNSKTTNLQTVGSTVVLFPPACGCASLLHTTSKPFNGELTLATLEKFYAFLEGMPLEQFGMKRGFLLFTVPSILVDIVNAGTGAIQRLGQLARGVIFVGAQLSVEIGDMLADNGVILSSGYGT
jgi:hypothetical protein